MPPPGYEGYNNPPAADWVKRIGGLGTTVMVLTAAVALGTVATTILSVGAAQDADKFLQGELTDSQFQSAIGPVNAVQLLTGLATLATAVLSIIWMYRIAKNVKAYGRQTTWSPLFAIFGWFLPPMVLYIIPFLMLRELWKASDSTVVDGSDSWKKSGENPTLWAWFVLYGLLPVIIIAAQVGTLTSNGIPSGDLDSIAESLEDFGALAVSTGLLTLVAAVAWILFVRQLTGRHKSLTGET